MKNVLEKVALVAQICITLVFVVTAVLFVANANNYANYLPDGTVGNTSADAVVVSMRSNNILFALMLVLALVYAGLSAYMLYVNFSARANLKQILLFCDSDSATHTNLKVINNVVQGCAKEVVGVAVKKVKIRADEKGGFVATFTVKADADCVSQSVNKLRCLLEESFKNTLGLTFNTINFKVKKLNGRYIPDVNRAEVLAQTLQEKQDECSNNYQEPLAEPLPIQDEPLIQK